MEEFTLKFDEFLKKLNPNKYDMYIMGDVNIDLLKCHSHQQTERYLDMIYSFDILPVITKPTSSTTTATLIDHIYTNTLGLSQLISRTICQSFVWLTHLSKSKIDKICMLEIIVNLTQNHTSMIFIRLTGM